jgi:hypothetical protein
MASFGLLYQPDPQLLGGVISCAGLPSPDYAVLEQPVLQHEVGHQLLQRADLPTQILDFVRGRRAYGIAGQALLASLFTEPGVRFCSAGWLSNPSPTPIYNLPIMISARAAGASLPISLRPKPGHSASSRWTSFRVKCLSKVCITAASPRQPWFEICAGSAGRPYSCKSATQQVRARTKRDPTRWRDVNSISLGSSRKAMALRAGGGIGPAATSPAG